LLVPVDVAFASLAQIRGLRTLGQFGPTQVNLFTVPGAPVLDVTFPAPAMFLAAGTRTGAGARWWRTATLPALRASASWRGATSAMPARAATAAAARIGGVEKHLIDVGSILVRRAPGVGDDARHLADAPSTLRPSID
jgi:hypothetical protein